jgi:hypothetical protein
MIQSFLLRMFHGSLSPVNNFRLEPYRMILTAHNHSGNDNNDERDVRVRPEITAIQVRLNIVSSSVRLNLSIVGLP